MNKKIIYGCFLLLAVLFVCSFHAGETPGAYRYAPQSLSENHKRSGLYILHSSTGNSLLTAQRHAGESFNESPGARKAFQSYGLYCCVHDVHAYTNAVAVLSYRRLLNYHTFSQLAALFPKHWFW